MTDGPGIIDTHVHLWDPREFDLGWAAGSVLDRPHLATDYADATGPASVQAFVCVEANLPPAAAVAEASWLRRQAELDPRLGGLVASAPVELGARALGRHLALLTDASGGLLRGVRRDLQVEPDPAFCLRPGFLAGLRLLAAHQLSFDICVSHAQLPAIVEMVRRCPETTFVLDHLGKPAVESRSLDPWRKDIADLANRPNASCKVSGLLTEARPGAHEDEFAPYVEHVLAAFGEDRVLFGSDWPVVTQTGSWRAWHHIVDALTQRLGRDARDKLFHGNAVAIYRLDETGPAGRRQAGQPEPGTAVRS